MSDLVFGGDPVARRAKLRLTLKPSVLKDLLGKEAADSVLIHGVEGGFQIVIGFGAEEKPLGLACEDRPRLFRTIDSAVKHLDKLGVTQVSLDWTRRSSPPKQMGEAKGPGQAAAHERTREAVDHDAWFRKNVEDALAQIDDGTADLIPCDDPEVETKRILMSWF